MLVLLALSLPLGCLLPGFLPHLPCVDFSAHLLRTDGGQGRGGRRCCVLCRRAPHNVTEGRFQVAVLFENTGTIILFYMKELH
jgi:hypothetical protein